MNTLQKILKMPVTSPWEAEKFITALVQNRYEWHFDDSPETIVRSATGEKLFEDDDVMIGKVKMQVAACFALLDDPHKTMLDCIDHRDAIVLYENEAEDELPVRSIEIDIDFDEADANMERMNRLIDRGMSAEEARESIDSLPPLDAENRITFFMHCGKCLEELKDGATIDGVPQSPSEYARLNFGYTRRGIQIWCERHDCNMVSIDFEAFQHPAV